MYSHDSYTVGIICALALEATAVIAMLDQRHPDIAGSLPEDSNLYTFGKIGEHMVVVACLPAGSIGTVNAAATAIPMMHSFMLRYGLMVGIGGGVPSSKTDIRLGDVVVSQPNGLHGGVIQWDSGKTEAGGLFHRTGVLNKPPRVLLNAVQKLKIRHEGVDLAKHLHDSILCSPTLQTAGYLHQGQQNDELFEAAYNHASGASCQHCDRSHLVHRMWRNSNGPEIHYGNIASGDQVVKDGRTRDAIAQQESILCFEMEAAGLMDTFPCLVIRGVCDYADSHKNKRWQPYAAATAAAYAKELLLAIPVAGSLVDTQPGKKAADGHSSLWNNYESKIGTQANYIHTQNQNITF